MAKFEHKYGSSCHYPYFDIVIFNFPHDLLGGYFLP